MTGLPAGEAWARGDGRPLGGVPVGDVWVLGARVLDPATHQFLSTDPLLPVPGTHGAASGYTYSWQDPVNWADPSGMRPLSIEEFDAIMDEAEQGTFSKAWEAIREDPWGTLAMVGVTAVGVGLCFTPLAPVGAGILIGVGASAGIGLATGTFNPRMVAVNGVVGGLSAGVGGAVATTTVRGAVALGMASGAGETIAGSLLAGQGFPSGTELVVGTVTGGTTSGGAHALTHLPTTTTNLNHTPTSTGTPPTMHQTTILGENMSERVMPFAEATGSRTLGFGATADEWAAMTPQQRYQLNDGMLRARIGEGDDFRYIGQDPLRPPDVRARFDLTLLGALAPRRAWHPVRHRLAGGSVQDDRSALMDDPARYFTTAVFNVLGDYLAGEGFSLQVESPRRVTYRRGRTVVSFAFFLEDLPSPWVAVDVGLGEPDGSTRLAGLWRALDDDEPARRYTSWRFDSQSSLEEVLRRIRVEVLAEHGPRVWDFEASLEGLLADQSDETETR